MKKLISLFLMCIILCGCNYDPYSGKRPFDYGDAIWVCEEANAYFTVDSSKDEYYSPEGEIQIDGEVIPIKMWFINQTKQVFISVNTYTHSDKEIPGDCEFSPDKLTVKVDKDRDTLLYGKYDELVFVRQETTTIK